LKSMKKVSLSTLFKKFSFNQKKSSKIVAISILSLFSLNQCTIIKRHYSPGFYIEKHSLTKSPKSYNSHPKKFSITSSKLINEQDTIHINPLLNSFNTTIDTEKILAENYTSYSPSIKKFKSPFQNSTKKSNFSTIEKKYNKKIETKKPNTDIEEKWSKCNKKFIFGLLLAIFLGFYGIHRYYMGDVGMGCLYTLTLGLFFIGWIYDIVGILLGTVYPKCDNNTFNSSKNDQIVKKIVPISIIGGSRSDGIVKVAFTYDAQIKKVFDPYINNYRYYEYPTIENPFNNPYFEIDKEELYSKVKKRCIDWGYKDFVPFESYNRECIDFYLGTCRKYKVSFECQCTDEEQQKSNFNDNNPSVKNITATGTGFLVNNNGYVVTNYHVISDAKEIKIFDVQKNIKYNAIVISKDIANDLALLKIEDQNFTKNNKILYCISNSTPRVGENVFVIGYPESNYLGVAPKYVNGTISALSGFQDDKSSIQTTCPVHSGNSGSPLFNEKGEIIGVINSKFSKGENVSYAIRIEPLKRLLQDNNLPLPSNCSLSDKSTPDKVDAIKNYIYLIEVKL